MPRLSLSAEYLAAIVRLYPTESPEWWQACDLLARHATFNLLNSKSDTLAKYNGRSRYSVSNSL
jgi:hypothetical protein